MQTWSGSEDSKKRKVFLKFKADSSSWVLGSGPYRRKGCIGSTLHRFSWEICSGYIFAMETLGGVWGGKGFVWNLGPIVRRSQSEKSLFVDGLDQTNPYVIRSKLFACHDDKLQIEKVDKAAW